MARHISGILAIALFLLSDLPGFATTHEFTENFDTTANIDLLQTAAEVDTVRGVLRFPEQNPTIVGAANYGIAFDQDLEGDLLYVAARTIGLQVYDVSVPSGITLVSELGLPGDHRSVTVDGNLAFVASFTEGMHIVDVSDPAVPVLLDTFTNPGFCTDVQIRGNVACASWYDRGLVLVDIGDPSSPAWLGSYDPPGLAEAVMLDGDVAFVGMGSSGVVAIDIKIPASPTLLGQWAGAAYDLALYGSRLLVASGNSGLSILDVSDPTTMGLLGSASTGWFARGVTADGPYAYVAASSYGIDVIDISDPAVPLVMIPGDTPGSAQSITVGGTHAYVSDDGQGIQVMEIKRHIDDPRSTGSWQSPGGWPISSLRVDGDYAYASANFDVEVLDVSNPSAPTPVAGPITIGNPREISGDLLVGVTESADGFSITDISDPTSPAILYSYTFFPPTSWTVDAAIAGKYLFIARGSLHILNITNPSSPLFSGVFPGTDIAWIEIDGDRAYCTGGNNFMVLDISTPTSPAIIGSVAVGSGSGPATVDGNLAYLFAYPGGLTVVDITDDTTPVVVGTTAACGNDPGWIALDGDRAYGTGGDRLGIYDVSIPSAPALVDSMVIECADIDFIGGDHIMFAGMSSGLSIAEASFRGLDQSADYARSPLLTPGSSDIVELRIIAETGPDVRWCLSAGGPSGICPGSSWPSPWLAWDNPAGQFEWRVTLSSADGITNTEADWVTFEWLSSHAYIDSIVDVPDDQGGYARVHFARSGWDSEFGQNSGNPVTGYDVYREIPAGPAADAVRQSYPRSATSPFMELGERSILIGDESGTVPPGVWEAVATLHALQQDTNIVLVPTLADSSEAFTPTNYFVTAHTTDPLVWYASPVESGYSVDNIAPGVPTGAVASYQLSGVDLDWDDSPEPDFQYYRVYRSTDPDFVPGPANLVVQTASSAWTDPTANPWDYSYRISAVDHSGNESAFGSIVVTTTVEDQPVTRRLVLHDAMPNPFNPSTTITFEIPRGGEVTMTVYDLSGRRVRTLLAEKRDAGRHAIEWDGADDRGRIVASGVYLYRLQTSGGAMTKRMTLLK